MYETVSLYTFDKLSLNKYYRSLLFIACTEGYPLPNIFTVV